MRSTRSSEINGLGRATTDGQTSTPTSFTICEAKLGSAGAAGAKKWVAIKSGQMISGGQSRPDICLDKEGTRVRMCFIGERL